MSDTVKVTVAGSYEFEGMRWYFAKDTTLSPNDYPFEFLSMIVKRGYAKYLTNESTTVKTTEKVKEFETVPEDEEEFVPSVQIEELVELEETYDITDSALALANENNVDLSSVVGTGVNGRILKKDIEALLD